MVNIRSVREPINAPEQSIMGGALQGFSAFANNMNRKKAAEQENRDKLGLALLTAYAQQNREIIPTPGGPINYGGQGYSVGKKKVDFNKKRKEQYDASKAEYGAKVAGYEGGFLEIPPEYQAIQDKEKEEKIKEEIRTALIFNVPAYSKWMTKGDPESLAKAQALEDRMLAASKDQYVKPVREPEEVKVERGLLQNVFNNPALDVRGYFNKPKEQKSKTSIQKPNKGTPAVTKQKYKEGQKAVKNGVEYTRNKDGVWKPSK